MWWYIEVEGMIRHPNVKCSSWFAATHKKICRIWNVEWDGMKNICNVKWYFTHIKVHLKRGSSMRVWEMCEGPASLKSF